MVKAKHPELFELLREKIINGEYEKSLPGINVLAREYDVNNRTMIKVIKSLENDGCVKRIPSIGTFVTRLKRQRTHILGIVIGTGETGPSTPIHTSLIKGISSASHSAGESYIIGKSHHQDPEIEISATRELVESRNVDGIVIWPSEKLQTGSESIEYLKKKEIPFVIIPEPNLEKYSGCHTVSNSDSGGATEIAEHLVNRGFRRIAFMSDCPVSEAIFVAHRFNQYKDVMDARGLPVIGLEIPSLYYHQEERISNEIMNKVKKCEAVFCCTDWVAVKLMRECLRLGIRVPGDLAVAGYDNSHFAAALDITSVEQHFDKIGEKAVNLLLDEIDGKCSKPRHLNVGSELIIRGSTGK